MSRRLVIFGTLIVLGVPFPALAQTEPDPPPSGTADISLTATGPATVPTGGSASFGFAVTNEGPEIAPQASFSISVPDGFADTLVTPDDPAIACTWNPYAYGSPEAGAPEPGSEGGYASCDLGDVPPGGTVGFTLEATRIRAYQLYLSGWTGSASEDPDYSNNYVEFLLDADRSAPADLGIALGGPKQVTVGGDFQLELAVVNNGPSDATSVRATLLLPDGAEVPQPPEGCTAETSPDGGGAVAPAGGEPTSDPPEFWAPPTIRCEVGSLAAGATKTYSIAARRTSGWELWSSAWVAGANYDEVYDNDYAYWTAPADPSVSSDLAVSVTPPATDPLLGDTFDVSYEVTNLGPAPAGDVVLYDYLPYGLGFVATSDAGCTFEDYSSKDPAPYEGDLGAPAPVGQAEGAYPIYYGGGFLNCDHGLVEVGQTIETTITLERTSAYELYDYTSVSGSNWDPDYENNYVDTIYGPDLTTTADVATSVDAPADVAVGERFAFTLGVTNLGPNPATGVGLYDYLPPGIEPTSETLPGDCTYNGNGGEGSVPVEDTRPSYQNARELTCAFGTLDPDESRFVTIEATRTSEWEIWNSAWATSTSFDPEYENDYAYFVLPGETQWNDCSFDESSGDDAIVTDLCPVAAGAGADTVNVEASTSGETRDVRTGAGPDRISVDVATGSTSERRIDVRAGRGNDTIDVTIAPGAGAVHVVIRGGRGADRIRVDVAPQARNVLIQILGGRGPDSVRTVRYPRAEGVAAVIRGGAGRDVLLGGNGPDRLFGQRGLDLLDAGAGDDLLDGGRKGAVCLDGPGDDSLRSCRRR